MTQPSLQRIVILVFFFLAVAGLLFAGGYAWVTLDKMLGSIDRLAEPNRKLERLSRINGSLSRINQMYRSFNYSDEVAVGDHAELFSSIAADIDSLQILNKADGAHMEGLDSILHLLRETDKGTRKLAKARKQSTQPSVPSKLIKELSGKIAAFKNQDSAYVVKSTTSEVWVSDYALQALDSLARVSDMGERAGLFRKIGKLFQRKEKQRQLAPTSMAGLQPERLVDTLTRVSVDSVNVVSNGQMILSLQEFLQNLYEAEIKNIRQLNQLEKSIQAQNISLLNTTEQLLAQIQAEERQRNEAARAQAYQTSGQFNSTLYLIVFSFAGAGLLLLLLLLRDIRRTRYYQRQLLRAKEKSERVARRKQDFLASMSHEIRTPLTSIVGYADLLQNGGEHHQAIKNSAEHLLHLTNEILDLAKIEAGIVEVGAEPVDLPQLLRDVQLSFALKIQEKGLAGTFDLPQETDVLVATDPHRLSQVFFNLLHNAIKFTEQGQVLFRARLQPLPTGQVKLTVQVKDTGIGIAPTDRQRIFEDFEQAGTLAYKRQGSGLGLGIVRKLVTLLGGQITLRSKQGRGSAFTTTFVFDRAEPQPVAVPIHYQADLFAGKRILVVDDDPLIGRLHHLILSSLGALPETCERPSQALDLAAHTAYDLAILDLQMPEMTGWELCERLGALPTPPGKIIASTANVLLTEQELASLCRFSDILYKPIRKAYLIQVLAKAMGIDEAPTAPIQPVLHLEKSILPPYYDLSELRRFAMGDEDELQDILHQLSRQNQDDLTRARQHLREQQPLALAEVLHQLTARFGQIGAVPAPSETRNMEIALRQEKPVQGLGDLLDYWESVNEAIKTKLKVLA